MSGILLQELLDFLNSYLKVHDFKDYCPNGLQLQGKNEIQKIAFSTSASLDVIKKAAENNVDALIVHHGLFWDKDSRVLEGALLEKVQLLIEKKINLIAYHLPLDAHKDVGNNFPFLKLLGAESLEHFENVGVKGRIKIKKEDLIDKVSSFYKTTPLIPDIEKTLIHSVAIVSGGAHSSIKACKDQQVDALITGTCDEWVWDFAKENNILFIPVGHYRSETLGVRLLGEYLKKTMGFEVCFIENHNPY
jgi:dinuclear metal center YbgI/SA1388 family protein